MHGLFARALEGALGLLASSIVVASVLLDPALASAQERGPRMHIGAGMALDFAGEVDLDRRIDFNYGEDGLRATPGIRGHLDYGVHRYISVGGMARMSWWEPERTPSIGRSFLLDLAPRLTGHYDYRQFRFYGGMAPGLTISAVQDRGIRVDNPGAGFTLSLTIVGCEWWFSRKVGLFAELGWVGHWFSQRNDVSGGELDFRLGQGLFEFGFVFGA